MKIVDANVLLYAVNSDAMHHEKARAWLDHALSGNDTVGFSWVALLAFVRISSRAGIFSDPLSVEDAMRQVTDWLAAPGAVVAQPGPGHAEHLARLLHHLGTGGNLVSDAHLAALAVEHRAQIVSYDNDFARFDGVRWRRPDDLLA
ncbi:MAG: type II toxin-antitoxin system VapC family toxin [Micropruina sp.]|nr:type II toxin-antitoxin system VapC family toxin [Micropruina sp.]